MCKILCTLFLGLIIASPAFATQVAPAPEVDGGILGMMFAAGTVYFLNRRRS